MTETSPIPRTGRSATRSVFIDVPPAEVFRFIADPQTLPQWAVGFCRSIRQDGDANRWIVATADGEIPIRYATNEAGGAIDFHFSPAPGLDVVAYSRVLPNQNGTEYVFTQFQFAGQADEVFDGQVRALTEELQVLRGVILARAACRL